MSKRPVHTLALLEVVFVSLVWASSFVLVKIALAELGPLTIGGLRYFLGFICLLPFLRRPVHLTGKLWLRLFLLGLSSYVIGNGATFIALQHLPAATVSFLMSTVTLTTVLGGVLWLQETPGQIQRLGILISLGGMALFFSPGLKPGEPFGLAILVVAVLGFTLFGLLGRDLARIRELDTLTLTALPLALGGGLMLAIALPIEGLPSASFRTWGLILFLAAVNTAMGYMLYNHALQSLQAFEMNVTLNLSPIWTALLGWFLLNETLVIVQWTGIFVVMLGVMLVQKWNRALT